MDNQYLYDGNGNRTHKKQLGGETLYHYDPLNQLKKVEYPGYTEELFYDKAGNRTRRISQGVEELYQYDPRNRLTAYTQNGVTTMFQYDNAGNLLVDDKAQYSYDAFNRTTKVETFDGNIQLNRYDAEGLRYEMEENGNLVQFIFNQEREAITEEDSTGLTRLIRATELIARSSDSARTYYHYASDEMGSTTHIVDEAGNVQNRYEYDAWGNLTAQEEAVPNRFKYTGQQFDPVTQQYYLRARFYNPVIARFTQEDTYRGDGLNLYAYCTNNPICYVDPTGHYSNCVKAAYDRIREENPTLSAKEAYQRALQERGFDKLSKEENRRRSEAANLNRQLKDPDLTPEQREQIYKKLDEVNNEFSGSNQKSTPHAETPTAESSISAYSLLPGEGDIGTYRDLLDAGKVGDNITPHHMPSAEYMAQHGISKKDGLCMNMEMPCPGTGGRHRLTDTYGRNMTDAEKAYYYSLSPRDALAYDIANMREIYQSQGLYSEIRPKLREYIKQYKELMPELFGKQ